MSNDLESILQRIVAEPALHARWLNTFSYLEYVGFRKIIKSQAANFISSGTLTHAVEEGRHALLLKKAAVKVGGPRFDFYVPEAMLCLEQATAYFQELERACESHCSGTEPSERARLVYLCVTWLVEVRALAVYTKYEKRAAAVGVRSYLTGLLAEEDRHLISVEEELHRKLPGFADRLAELKGLEETLYRRFLSAVSEELGHEIVNYA